MFKWRGHWAPDWLDLSHKSSLEGFSDFPDMTGQHFYKTWESVMVNMAVLLLPL